MNRKTELNHVVYSGWMIKSPPEKKLTGPWKIFRALSGAASNPAKWKRRYFVLSKPAQSLPGTYLLHYFSDENCKRLKGYIDLEQCAEIIESLDSDQFQYLLAIKTTHKGRDRTYFLATETEEQMTTWVRNLCSVCGMKPDESGSEAEGSPQPPVREELPRKTQLTQPASSLPPSHVGIMSKPNISTTLPANRNSPSTKARSGVTLSTKSSTPTPTPKSQTNNERDSEYLPLSDCTSGPSIKRAERQESVDSVPDDFAPPPPVRKGHESTDSDVFATVGSVNNAAMLYDIPPSGKMDEEEEDLYKVPPSRPSRDMSSLEPYDILPSHHSPSTPRSSSSESQKVDSAYSSQGFYDTPPTRSELTQDDTYDVPPSHNNRHSLEDTPPARPPKPIHLSMSVPGQEPYMNLPTNSKILNSQSVDINSVVLPPPIGMTKMDPSELYDFPRATVLDNHNNNNNIHSDKVIHGMVPPPNSCGQKEHKYLNAYHGFVDESQKEMYVMMDPVTNKPRKSSSTDNEVEYTDMSGRSDFDDSFEGKTVYDHPPPSRPTIPPPRPLKTTLTETQDTYSIFSTTRTRSFKKKATEGSPSVKRRSPTSPVVQSSATVKVPLPQRSMEGHPDFSTSDEDDDDMGHPDVWETTVPAPTNKDTELKYVDLDHDEDKEPMRSPHSVSSSLTPTEYHEIDFVKTTVLQNLKEQRNKKSSDTT